VNENHIKSNIENTLYAAWFTLVAVSLLAVAVNPTDFTYDLLKIVVVAGSLIVIFRL
jgi:hypothetical protein